MLNPYVILAALAAFFVTGVGGYVKGRADCSAKYEVAALTAERDALRSQMAAENKAREADAKRLADNEALLRDLQQKAEDDAKNLHDGDRVCFDPADADSLRQHFRLPN